MWRWRSVGGGDNSARSVKGGDDIALSVRGGDSTGRGWVCHRPLDPWKNRTLASTRVLDRLQSMVEVRARRDQGEMGEKLQRARR
jgi:hypothetical protein